MQSAAIKGKAEKGEKEAFKFVVKIGFTANNVGKIKNQTLE